MEKREAAPPSGPGTRPLDKREIVNIDMPEDSLPGCLGETRSIFPNLCITCGVALLCRHMRAQRDMEEKRNE
ncbi:MAG: hypothetical protein JRN53_05370 [Nitrososphaerota archaeon]|nr:hypothetical protein [Nitrososphaerota archaeon]